MTTHPTQLQLERSHAGEQVVEIEAHLVSCAQCLAAVDALSAERDAFLAKTAPDAFVRKLRRRAEALEAAETRSHPRARGVVIGLVAAAATALLALRPGTFSSGGGVRSSPGETGSRAETSLRSRAEPRASTAQGTDMVHKGAAGFAVIRERHGEQTVERHRLRIAPEDKLRLRFQLAEPQHMSAGIVLEDGSWVPFFEGRFGSGTHSPQATLQVDERPSSGRILLGPSESVARARRGHPTAAVQVVELVWGSRREGG